MDEQRDTLEVDASTRAAIDALEDTQREKLQTLIDQAAAEQRRLLEDAVENALAVIPAPLRKQIRKLMRG